jgi:hypothetical protein
MEPPPTPDAQAQAVVNGIANELARGKRPAAVIDGLAAAGMDKGEAIKLVYKVEEMVGDAKRKQVRKKMIAGALWCGGGCLVTIFTYAAASRSGGGGYVVAWGAIIFGAWQMIQAAMAD